LRLVCEFCFEFGNSIEKRRLLFFNPTHAFMDVFSADWFLKTSPHDKVAIVLNAKF